MSHWTRRRLLGMSAAACAGRLASLSRGAAPATRPSTRPTPGLVEYGPPRHYRITHTAELQLNDIKPTQLDLWLPVPRNYPEQEIRDLRIEPRVPVFVDPNEHAAVAKLHLAGNALAPGQTHRLTVSYRVARRTAALDRTAASRQGFSAYRKDRWYTQFTRAEKRIEVANPAIVKQAAELHRPGQSPLDGARRIYDWVLDHTEYRLVHDLFGAVHCLENGYGECGDYSALFVALCRAAGIPARAITGCWCEGVDKWHCWAEFMLPTGDWVPVDPSAGDQNRLRRAFCFGSTDNQRLALCKTLDIRLPAGVSGQRDAEVLQFGAYWWHAYTIPPGAQKPAAKFTLTGQRDDS